LPLISVFRKQRLVDLCDFEARLFYKGSSSPARATQRNPVLKKNQPPPQKKKRKKERKEERKKAI
jgi:hypothetical protein